VRRRAFRGWELGWRARWVTVALVGWFVGVAPPAAAAGPWVWPLDGPHTVSRGFDPPTTAYGAGHRGADLPGRPGQAVRAAGAGRISYAGQLAGRGVVVVVHGDLRTTYEPVTPGVPVGAEVAAGAIIGRLVGGHAGCPGTCLHWGLLRGPVYLDPVQVVRRGPSRLLPLAAAAPGGAPFPQPADVPVVATPSPATPGLAGSDDQPALVLRSADTGWAAGALVALLAGVALLVRPPRPPDGPATPSVPAVPVAPLVPPPVLAQQSPAGLVDLASERDRRRPSVA
jgi:hypothetical protein